MTPTRRLLWALGSGTVAAGAALSLWAIRAGKVPLMPASSLVPPFVFYVIWPLIYVALAFVFFSPSSTRIIRACALLYVALSYLWIASPSFVVLFLMLWVVLVCFANAALVGAPNSATVLTLPVAWTIVALVLSAN
jgi:hypothetical protein